MNKFLSLLSVLLVACVTAFPVYAQEVKGDAKAGEKKIAMCIGCHGIQGYQASFPEIYKVPKISGQGAKYIISALSAYKKGDRKHPTMRGVADNLSDQDMADLAAYYESHGKVDGAMVSVKATEGSAKAAELVKKGACVSRVMATISVNPLTPATPKLRGSMATTCLLRSSLTRRTTIPKSGVPTASWVVWSSSSRTLS